MNSETMKKIRSGYETRRSEAENAAKRRRAELFAQQPQLAEIDRELSATGASALKYYLAHPDLDQQTLLTRLKSRTDTLLAEKKQILNSLGLPEDYLEVHYTCPHCEDTGYLPDGQRCRCMTQRIIDAAYQSSGTNGVLEKENFNTFNLNVFPQTTPPGRSKSPAENVRTIANEVFAYCRNFPNCTPKNILFYGPPGTGKTFLCNCIAKALLDRGFTVLYLSSSELMRQMADDHFSSSSDAKDDTESIRDRLREVDMLIIDDLGAEHINSLTVAHFFECLNTRLQLNLATVISTNFSLKGIADNYTDRTSSRIQGYFRMYEFYGKDLRVSLL